MSFDKLPREIIFDIFNSVSKIDLQKLKCVNKFLHGEVSFFLSLKLERRHKKFYSVGKPFFPPYEFFWNKRHLGCASWPFAKGMREKVLEAYQNGEHGNMMLFKSVEDAWKYAHFMSHTHPNFHFNSNRQTYVPIPSVFTVNYLGGITYENLKKINLVSQTSNVFIKRNDTILLDYLSANAKYVSPVSVHWAEDRKPGGGSSCFLDIKPKLLLDIDRENQACKIM